MPLDALTLDRAVAPLDRLRRAVLLGLARVPAVRARLAPRDERARVQSLAAVGSAFALTMLAPGVLFVVGPALFGVAHVASDARYLVLRRDLPRWWLGVVVGGCAALFVLRALEAAVGGAGIGFATAEVGLGWTWAAVGAVAGAAAAGTAGAGRRAMIVAPLLAALGVAAIARPMLARLIFAHAHNVVAIALWLWLFRARRRFALPAVVALMACVMFLVSGAALRWAHLEGPGAARLIDEALFAWPAWMPQRTAVGLALVYVMLQSVHYSVWLALIPQEDAPAQGTRSFRMSVRALRRDFPGAWLAAIAVLVVVVLGASFLDVHRTRQLYLSLATFHGYLELAAGAFLVVRGKQPA